MNKAIYPGTFDPITLGHLDVIQRASHIFSEVTVAVAVSRPKNLLFSQEERVDMARETVSGLSGVKVEPFDGLLVDYAASKGVQVLIRGIRAFTDFEYEFQMALINRKMEPDLETLFLLPKEEYGHISSTSAKEIAMLGGDTSTFLPPVVQKRLQAKFEQSRGRE